MTNPLPQPQEKPTAQPALVEERWTPAVPTVRDWRATLRAHARGWLHRRRLLWKQTAAGVLVTAATLLLWLLLVEALD